VLTSKDIAEMHAEHGRRLSVPADRPIVPLECHRCRGAGPIPCQCDIYAKAEKFGDISFNRDPVCWTYHVRGQVFEIYADSVGMFRVNYWEGWSFDTLVGAMLKCREHVKSDAMFGATGAYPM